MLKKPISLLFAFCVAVLSGTSCNRHKTGTSTTPAAASDNLERVLSWLPEDTETLLVANGPFWMSNFEIDGRQYRQNPEINGPELEKQFESLTLGLFNSKNRVLEKHLEGKKVLLAAEGSRHFRPPASLGELPYEGCAIGIFADDLVDRRDAFLKDAALVAARMEEIEGQRIAVFQERSENDTWTTFVAFPQKNVVLVATNRDFLREMLVRMKGNGAERALPESLSEWQYVNKKAKFWGLRHYDRSQAREDPTSPFGGKKSANLPDEKAIGLTYECDPTTERRATLTYLSREKNEISKIERDRFPSEPEDTAGLHIQYLHPEPGVIRSTYDLSRFRPLSWFFFVFMGSLGHAIYV